MINDILNDAKSRMAKSIESLKAELTKLRTGRAHPSLLDHITVDYYGSEVPLSQVANIGTDGPRTLTVAPWEKPMVQVVEKAIMTSDLGLNPATSGQLIRVPLPPLTEERRRDLVKVVKEEGERAKVSIRNIRRDANGDLKDLEKAKDITEDDLKRSEQQVQKLTDEKVQEIDSILSDKEKDLMEV